MQSHYRDGKKRSLMLLLAHEDGRLLFGRETRGNTSYGKRPGDYTPPWETWEEGMDRDMMVRQACDQEGGTGIRFRDLTLLIEYLPVHDTLATIMTARFVSAVNFRGTAVDDGEIMEPGMLWLPLGCFVEEFACCKASRLPMRDGVKEALQFFARQRWCKVPA